MSTVHSSVGELFIPCKQEAGRNTDLIVPSPALTWPMVGIKSYHARDAHIWVYYTQHVTRRDGVTAGVTTIILYKVDGHWYERPTRNAILEGLGSITLLILWGIVTAALSSARRVGGITSYDLVVLYLTCVCVSLLHNHLWQLTTDIVHLGTDRLEN